MPMLPGMGWLLGLLLTVVVLSDVAYQRVPRGLAWLLLALWALHPLLALFGAGPWVRDGSVSWDTLLLRPLVGALAVLVAGHFLLRLRRVERADVDLMTLLMLWMADRQWMFLVVAALAGGALALGRPWLAQAGKATAKLVARVLSRWPSCAACPAAATPAGDARLIGVPYSLAAAFGVVYAYGLLP